MYELDRPAYLQLLLLVPLLWGLFAYVLHYRRKKQDALATPRILMILAPYKSTAALAWKTILYTLVIVLLTLALVNPRIGTQIEKIKVQGSDVVFALDVSLSMKAEDVAPDRLEKAKQIISRTIDRLGGDRVGIIAYAGSAYPLLPITSDYSAAKMFLATADPSMVSSQGTSMASPSPSPGGISTTPRSKTNCWSSSPTVRTTAKTSTRWMWPKPRRKKACASTPSASARRKVAPSPCGKTA